MGLPLHICFEESSLQPLHAFSSVTAISFFVYKLRNKSLHHSVIYIALSTSSCLTPSDILKKTQPNILYSYVSFQRER